MLCTEVHKWNKTAKGSTACLCSRYKRQRAHLSLHFTFLTFFFPELYFSPIKLEFNWHSSGACTCIRMCFIRLCPQSKTSLSTSLLKVAPGRVRFQRVWPHLFLFAIAGCPERQTELIERRPRKKNTLSPERDG